MHYINKYLFTNIISINLISRNCNFDIFYFDKKLFIIYLNRTMRDLQRISTNYMKNIRK